MIVDLFLVYTFIRKLSTPFNKWKAFELGIIDDKGNILKDRSELNTIQEKNAFGYFDVIILNLKKMIEKLPGGRMQIATYAAALALLRAKKKNVNEEKEAHLLFIESLEYLENKDNVDLMEEIVNAVGSGAIEGIGIGDKGEPGFNKKQMDSYKKKNTMLKRFKDTTGASK